MIKVYFSLFISHIIFIYLFTLLTLNFIYIEVSEKKFFIILGLIIIIGNISGFLEKKINAKKNKYYLYNIYILIIYNIIFMVVYIKIESIKFENIYYYLTFLLPTIILLSSKILNYLGIKHDGIGGSNY